MQTFLPYPSFLKSARVLDRQRLGKQRVEGLQILQCLLGVGSQRWRFHPAVCMWRGYEFALAMYILSVCHEWQHRGYRDTVANKVRQLVRKHGVLALLRRPPWLGDPSFHRSHQSNLVRKDPAWYRRKFPKVSATYPYVWPTKEAR